MFLGVPEGACRAGGGDWGCAGWLGFSREGDPDFSRCLLQTFTPYWRTGPGVWGGEGAPSVSGILACGRPNVFAV